MTTLYFIFYQSEILLEKHRDLNYSIPKALIPFENYIHKKKFHLIHLKSSYSAEILSIDAETKQKIETNNSGDYIFSDLRNSFYKLAPEEYKLAGKCYELNYWNLNTKFCGKCGSELVFSSQISKKCPSCHTEIWPKLSVAIIVLIQRKDKVLLVQARNFKKDFHGLVAGFVETGENLEEAVRREVKEETNLEIENLKYFSSQEWPFPSGIMVGFTADYKSGELKIDSNELKHGDWYDLTNLPTLPEKLSIARKIIDDWIDMKSNQNDNN